MHVREIKPFDTFLVEKQCVCKRDIQKIIKK